MSTAKAVSRRPRWYFVPVRVALVTGIITLLSFAVSLFLGIMTIMIVSWIRGAAPNMALAYRHVAAPVAGVVGAVALLSTIVIEVGHYRRASALASIEQASR
jgi:hypothetical protein